MNSIYCFGEVLWDLFPSGAKPGGAPMNVAFHAKNLGLDSHIISATGDDELGTKLRKIITDRGIGTAHLQTNNLNTGTVTVHTDDPSNVRYTIDEPSAWDAIDPVNLELNDQDTLVFGTLAARSNHTLESLLKLLRSDAFKALDLNLRPPYIDWTWVAQLLPSVDLLKVNEEEYEYLRKEFSLPTDPSEGMAILQKRYHISYLVLSRGRNGALLFTPDAQFESKTYDINIVDSVGAGDSFLAALIFGLRMDLELQLTLDYAGALGAMVAGEEGANPVFGKEDIRKFVEAHS